MDRYCSVAVLKAGLSRVLSEVSKGKEYIVTDHNKPIARIISIHRFPAVIRGDLSTILKLKPIRLKKGAVSTSELIRAIRDEDI